MTSQKSRTLFAEPYAGRLRPPKVEGLPPIVRSLSIFLK
jgi:hypothetical protein